MYLVFGLPEMGDNDPSPHTIAFWLHREIDLWAEKYQITYKTKFHKNRLRLVFSNDSEYHFFMLSWSPNFYIGGHKLDEHWSKPKVVNLPKY